MRAILITCASILIFSSTAIAAPGDLIWQSYYDRSGAQTDQAYAVAVRGNRVFVAGLTTDTDGTDFSVRAYSATDGTLLWENHYDADGLDGDRARKIAVHRNKVVVVGETNSTAGSYAFTVRTFDAASGSLLWSDEHDAEGTGTDRAYDVAIKGRRVIVVGRTHTAADGTRSTVRAYRLNDGTLLWSDDYNQEEGNSLDFAYAVAVQGRRVYVGGISDTTEGASGANVRCYRLRSGSLIWVNNFDREEDGDDEADDIIVQGRRVYVAGGTWTDADRSDFSAWALRARNGNLRWQDHHDAGSSLSEYAGALAYRRGRIFVAGFTRTDDGGRAFTVRAYRSRNGNLIWSDEHDYEGSEHDSAEDIVVQGRRVYAVGYTTSASGNSTMVVRAYSAKNGTLLWQNRFDREGIEADFANAVAIQRNRLFVVGRSDTAAGDGAFAVRAHRLR